MVVKTNTLWFDGPPVKIKVPTFPHRIAASAQAQHKEIATPKSALQIVGERV